MTPGYTCLFEKERLSPMFGRFLSTRCDRCSQTLLLGESHPCMKSSGCGVHKIWGIFCLSSVCRNSKWSQKKNARDCGWRQRSVNIALSSAMWVRGYIWCPQRGKTIYRGSSEWKEFLILTRIFHVTPSHLISTNHINQDRIFLSFEWFDWWWW